MKQTRHIETGFLYLGLIVTREIFDPPAEEQLFDDEDFWVVSVYWGLITVEIRY